MTNASWVREHFLKTGRPADCWWTGASSTLGHQQQAGLQVVIRIKQPLYRYNLASCSGRNNVKLRCAWSLLHLLFQSPLIRSLLTEAADNVSQTGRYCTFSGMTGSHLKMNLSIKLSMAQFSQCLANFQTPLGHNPICMQWMIIVLNPVPQNLPLSLISGNIYHDIWRILCGKQCSSGLIHVIPDISSTAEHVYSGYPSDRFSAKK